MRSLRSLVGLSLLVLTACGTELEVTNPDGNVPQTVAPSGAACTTTPSVTQITADLNSLMLVLTPNSQSAQSKWQSVLANMAAGNYAQAQTDLATLLNFINLKYGQVIPPGSSLTIDGIPIETFKSTLLDNLVCYVELNSYDLNPGDTEPSVFPNAINTAAVWFPPGAVQQGTNVVISETPPTVDDFDTDLDGYPSFIRITLVDGDGNEVPDALVPGVKPIVVVCFPSNILGTSVAERARLGHQSPNPLKGFELLEPVDIPSDLAAAVNYCGDDPSDLPIATTALERAVRKVADFLLPEKAYAMFFAYGGVGGSPEEFSPFGAFDPGLNFGGAGGSPEEFAPGALPSASAAGPQTSTLSGDGPTVTVTGNADETDNTALEYDLPRVRVATPLGNPIVGVTVLFELSPAVGPDQVLGTSDDPDGSAATLCNNGATSATAVTNSEGWAEVPCINFGTDPGVKNLKASFNPIGIDPLACIIDPDTALCVATAEDADLNFKVVTVPGAPAQLTLYNTPGATAAAGIEMTQQPILQVRDLAGNTVSLTSSITVTSVTVTNPDGSSCALTNCSVSAFTTTTDLVTGRVTFDDLALGGKIGNSYKLTFNATGLTSTWAIVAVTAAGTPANIQAMTPSLGAYSGTFDAFVPVTPNPAVLATDAYGNAVSTGITWTKNLADASVSTTSTTSDGSGQSSITWTLGAGSNTLTAGLTSYPAVTPATFTATGVKTTIAACTVSGSQKKTDLAAYSSSIGGYLGRIATTATAAGAIRSAELAMSVTGQSSGTGGYVTQIRAYKVNAAGAKSPTTPIATGTPYNASNLSDATLRIPGDNGSPSLIRFNLTPVAGQAVAIGDRILFEVQITAASTRTFQVWYNTKASSTTCGLTKVFAAGVTNFNTGIGTAGVTFNARNYLYPTP